MSNIRLSAQDIDYISRVVATEIPSSIRRNPLEYNRMVGAVVDTIMNRAATGRYGSSITDVLNQDRAFSKIAGPEKMDPYGTVQNTPEAPPFVKDAVEEYVSQRSHGKTPEIGGSTDYANPNFSDKSNIRGWINPMIQRGSVKLGIGNAVHYHGTAPGKSPAPQYDVEVEGARPAIEPDVTYRTGVPIPTPRNVMAQMANARTAEIASNAQQFDRGGILDAPQISLSPVSSAQAGEMPSGLLEPVSSSAAPASLQIERIAPLASAYSQPNPATTATAQYSEVPPSNVASPDAMTAAYQQYGATRVAAPVSAPIAMPVSQTYQPEISQQIEGPLGGQSIEARTFPAAPEPPTFGQKVAGRIRNATSPENLKKAGASAALGLLGSAVAGPAGGILGGLLGREMASGKLSNNGQGLLSGLFGGNGPSWDGERNFIGSGINATSRAMWGGNGGDTAAYHNASGGLGGTITNMGNGSFQRHSDRYGWTETVHPDGSTSIDY